MVSRVRAALAVAVLTTVSGCGSGTAASTPAAAPGASSPSSAARVPVATSTDFYGDVVRAIGGEHVEVTAIIDDPAQDPHSYEANPRNQLALSTARLVIANGGGYDDFVGTMLGAGGNAERQVLDVVALSGRTAPNGEELNEHVWYDLPTMMVLGSRIAAALSALDPAHASEFAASAAAFAQSVHALALREEAFRAEHPGAKVAITEPVPLYLLWAMGVENLTPEDFSEAIEEGTDVPASVLLEVAQLLSRRQVQALVYNEQTSGPQTEQLRTAARDAGIPIVSVTETLPSGQGYLQWMAATLDALEKALA